MALATHIVNSGATNKSTNNNEIVNNPSYFVFASLT